MASDQLGLFSDPAPPLAAAIEALRRAGPGWGSPVELERKRRIVLSVAAYAYECCAESIMSDHDYDMMSLRVDLAMDTGRPDLDAFFRAEFNPSSGQWIRAHPNLSGVASLYRQAYQGRMLEACGF